MNPLRVAAIVGAASLAGATPLAAAAAGALPAGTQYGNPVSDPTTGGAAGQGNRLRRRRAGGSDGARCWVGGALRGGRRTRRGLAHARAASDRGARTRGGGDALDGVPRGPTPPVCGAGRSLRSGFRALPPPRPLREPA